MSGPVVVPRSTLATDAVAAGAAIGAGSTTAGAGGRAGAASSFFLQPTMATLPITAMSRAW